jgi:hypothetical protein
MVIQMRIMENHQNGKDTHVRGTIVRRRILVDRRLDFPVSLRTHPPFLPPTPSNGTVVRIRVYLDFELDESYTPTKMVFAAGMGGNDLIDHHAHGQGCHSCGTQLSADAY